MSFSHFAPACCVLLERGVRPALHCRTLNHAMVRQPGSPAPGSPFLSLKRRIRATAKSRCWSSHCPTGSRQTQAGEEDQALQRGAHSHGDERHRHTIGQSEGTAACPTGACPTLPLPIPNATADRRRFGPRHLQNIGWKHSAIRKTFSM